MNFNDPIYNMPLSAQLAQRSVWAAYDSVNLINNIVTLSASEENINTAKRNSGHLEIMLSKASFSDTLSGTQVAEIYNPITIANTFVSSAP